VLHGEPPLSVANGGLPVPLYTLDIRKTPPLGRVSVLANVEIYPIVPSGPTERTDPEGVPGSHDTKYAP
jgi:hypothetical protein